MTKDIYKYLAYDSAFQFNKEVDLKIKLERLRHESHTQTSEMLQKLDFINIKHLKKLVNY